MKSFKPTHVQRMRQGRQFKDAIRTGQITPIRRSTRQSS